MNPFRAPWWFKFVCLCCLLCCCAPTYLCEEPCQGQSASEDREGGIVCGCTGAGVGSKIAAPDGVTVLVEGAGVFAAKFEWTDDGARCAGFRDWWAARAPLPCVQPGGGTRRQEP